MVTTPAFLGAWGVLPNTSDKRNIMQAVTALSQFSPTVDADFDEGYAVGCVSTASGPAMFEAVHLDALTLADGDIFYCMLQVSLEVWTPASAYLPILIIEETRHSSTAGYGKGIVLLADDAATDFKVQGGDGTNVRTSSAIGDYTLGTPQILMVSAERLSSTTAEFKMWSWDGSDWNEVGSVSGTFIWADFGSIKSVYVGSPLTAAKGENGTIRVSRVICSVNVIPAGSMLCDHQVLPETPDGSTYDEWTPQTGSDNWAMVDDALGSESDTDYMDSGSTTLQKTQELNFAAVSGVSDTIRGLVITAGVVQTPATCNGTAYMAMRLSGTDSSFLDAYYGDSAWDASGNAEAEDTSRFFEKDPSGTAWTQTNVNSATYLFRKVATGASENWRIGALVLQVLHGDTWEAAAGGTTRVFAWIQ